MTWKPLALAGVLVVAACAATPPPARSLDLGPAAQADDRWAPPVAHADAAPIPGTVGEPMALAQLVENRLQSTLDTEDKRLIDAAANRALNAARAGATQEWDNPATGDHGEIVLASRDAMGDGRVCAILHHTHVFASQTIRGSLTICRRAGEPWVYEDLRWLRSGGDLVRLLPGEARAARAAPNT